MTDDLDQLDTALRRDIRRLGTQLGDTLVIAIPAMANVASLCFLIIFIFAVTDAISLSFLFFPFLFGLFFCFFYCCGIN